MANIYSLDQTTACVISSSSEYPGWVDHYVVDENENSAWSTNGSLPQYLQVDFGSLKRDICKLRIRSHSSYYNEAPNAFTLKASDNSDMSGSVTLVDVSGLDNWAALEWREWTFSNGTAYRYYRITITNTQNGTSEAVINEIELMAYWTDLGSDICSSGTISADSADGDFSVGNLVDNNLSTYWLTNNTMPHWVQYDFGAGNAGIIQRVRLYCETMGRMPGSFTVKASNTGSFSGEENTLLTVSGLEN